MRNRVNALMLVATLALSACASAPLPPNAGQPAGAPLIAAELKKAVDWADTALEIARTVQTVEIEAYGNQRLSDAQHKTVQEGFLEFFGAAEDTLLAALDLTKSPTDRWAAAKAVGALAFKLVGRIEPYLPPEVLTYLRALQATLVMLGFGAE